MEISTREISGIPVMVIIGDVDLSSSPQVRTVLLELSGKRPLTVVDMSGVGSIDSSGIASLLEGHQLAKKRGCRLILAACGASVSRVLGLAKLENVFSLAATIDDALGEAE